MTQDTTENSCVPPMQNLVLIGQVVSEEKIFEIVDGRTDNRRTTDGRTPDHGHPISSPCEPNGSGKLKIHCCKNDQSY